MRRRTRRVQTTTWTDERPGEELRENYMSAQEHMSKVRDHVEKDVQKGWMCRMALSEARDRYGDDLQVASLGAVPKDVPSE